MSSKRKHPNKVSVIFSSFFFLYLLCNTDQSWNLKGLPLTSRETFDDFITPTTMVKVNLMFNTKYLYNVNDHYITIYFWLFYIYKSSVLYHFLLLPMPWCHRTFTCPVTPPHLLLSSRYTRRKATCTVLWWIGSYLIRRARTRKSQILTYVYKYLQTIAVPSTIQKYSSCLWKDKRHSVTIVNITLMNLIPKILIFPQYSTHYLEIPYDYKKKENLKRSLCFTKRMWMRCCVSCKWMDTQLDCLVTT